MNVENNLLAFKLQLLKAMPFYGDLLFHLEFEEDRSVPTACTNGKKIFYNRRFMSKLEYSQQNFIWMHEVMHIILLHSYRSKKNDHFMWNVAADLVVNSLLEELKKHMKTFEIPFEKPPEGLFANVPSTTTVETVYGILVERNKGHKNQNTVIIPKWFYANTASGAQSELPVPQGIEDLPKNVPDQMAGNNKAAHESKVQSSSANLPDIPSEIRELIENALKTEEAGRSPFGHSFIPQKVYTFFEKAAINWKAVLKQCLTEKQSDETAYATPERKYIHMDLILPGHGESEETLETIWAFIDCSGSISDPVLRRFLTELRQITKDFHCTLNIAYWDTKVGAVYENIQTEKDLKKAMPTTSGGTDINCVYQWIKQQKKRPETMLILTDGYFGSLQNHDILPRLRKNTILVLSTSCRTEDMKRIGKIASVE